MVRARFRSNCWTSSLAIRENRRFPLELRSPTSLRTTEKSFHFVTYFSLPITDRVVHTHLRRFPLELRSPTSLRTTEKSLHLSLILAFPSLIEPFIPIAVFWPKSICHRPKFAMWRMASKESFDTPPNLSAESKVATRQQNENFQP